MKKIISRFLIVLLSVQGLPVICAQAADNGSSVLNADNIELKNFIDIVSRQTGKRFVVQEDIGSQKVSLISFEDVKNDELYDLLLSILDSLGMTVVEKGGALHVVKMPEETTVAMPAKMALTGAESEGVQFRVLKLTHVSVNEIRRVLEPLVRGGAKGALSAFGPTNHLLIVESKERMQLILDVIAELDKEGSARTLEVVALSHASAEEIAREVSAALQGMETAGSQVSRRVQQVTAGNLDLPAGHLVIPSPQANSLILVGSPLEIQDAKRIIEKLDVASSSGSGRHHVIDLKYIAAEEIAKSLEGLFAKSAGKDEARRIAVEPVISSNALLVDANPLDFDNVKALVAKLDVEPQMVMVEVLIAEMADSNSLEIGTEWATIEAPEEGRTTGIARSRPGDTDGISSLVSDLAFTQGLTLSLARGAYTDAAGNVIPRIPFLLRAVAGNREVRILSKPALVAQNNKKATVSVVDNIPILRSTIQGGTGSDRDVIQNIEREDVGLTLTLTPHVTPDSKISIDLNPQIAAIIDQGTAATPFTPTISKREINTTVMVSNGETILISGLMRKDRIMEESRVPFLGNLPIIGWLFRNREERKQTTNLLVFVTPILVSDPDAAAEQRRKWETDTGLPGPFESQQEKAEPILAP